MRQKPLVGYGSQFALLLALLGVLLILGSLLIGFIASQVFNVPLLQAGNELLKPQNVQMARLLNTAATAISFFLPALIVAKISSPKPFESLGFNRAISFKQIILVLFITLGGLFLSGSLAALNEMIPMPASFLKKARELEATYQSAMLTMATMKNFGDYLLTLVVIGLAPAIFEEVLFRGGMQSILINWFKSPWIGIIFTAVIFSAIHGSYFGFLPRIGLGIVLGLVFYLSKNLWLSILMHFFNNAVVVTQIYYLTKMGKPVKEAMEETMPIWIGGIALIGLIVIFRLFQQESNQVQATHTSNHSYELVD
jgi:membrane protease YdiL (CAAX protease family)